MKKILGIFGLLVAVFLLTWAIEAKFASAYNLQNIIRWTSLFGIISIGVAFVIITGGIDLSIGSLIGLVGCILPMLLVDGHSAPVALFAVFVMYGLSVLPLVYCYSFMFDNATTAQISIIMFNLIGAFVMVLAHQIMRILPTTQVTHALCPPLR